MGTPYTDSHITDALKMLPPSDMLIDIVGFSLTTIRKTETNNFLLIMFYLLVIYICYNYFYEPGFRPTSTVVPSSKSSQGLWVVGSEASAPGMITPWASMIPAARGEHTY